MNVVYVKNFENGKKYVGITNNFERRMREHKNAKDDLPVHRAMRKYKHYTEVVFESELYSDVRHMERVIIQNFKDLGYELYNITDGGEGLLNPSEEIRRKLSESKRGENNSMYGKHLSEETRRKLSEANRGEKNPNFGKHFSEETRRKMSESRSGEKNPMSKPMEWYETNSVQRSNFKKICKKRGWNFDDFEEVFSEEWYVKPNGNRERKYYYIYKGEFTPQ